MKKITLLKSLFVVFALSLTTLLGAADYVKVTTTPADWSGTYLIVCEDALVALTDAVDGVNNGTEVTISDGKITTDANLAFTIAAVDGGYSIQAPNGKYIGSIAADANELKIAETAYTNTISIEEGSIKIVGTSSVLRYNANKDQNRFRYFKSSTYTKQKPIQLYKLVSGEEGGDVVEPEPEPDPEEPTPDPEEPDASEVTKATVAEFLAAEVDAEVWYELTGVISRIASSEWGNFDLTDATGTVYIYGLTATQVSSNDKSFASLGLVVNDTITIRSVRGEYNGEPQGGGKTTPAYFISVNKYVAPEGGETPDPEEPDVEKEYVDEDGYTVYPFANHSDFAKWETSYTAHTLDYAGATVTFESANKQTSTITDIPVTKGKYVQLELKDANKVITSVRFVGRQWRTKEQTITLNVGSSVDNLVATEYTSDNFALEVNTLPANTKVIRFTFSSGDNQIGIESIAYTFDASGKPVEVENIAMPEIYTENGMIMAEGEFQIFTVTGQNVTDMNGNLANGVYVVRTANATAKVVIK